jgi:hypothetical protein
MEIIKIVFFMISKSIIFSKGSVNYEIEILNEVRCTTPLFPLEGKYWYVDVVRNDVYIN